MEKYSIDEIMDLLRRYQNGEEIDIGSIGYMMQHSEASDEFSKLIDDEIEKRKKDKENNNG